jgi:rhodanese-related sulfurtransferase
MFRDPIRTSVTILLVVTALLGCRADTSGLDTLDLPQLMALLEADDSVVLCDANTKETREKLGVIPGAILLSSYRDYNVNRELPAEPGRKLVFYCHSPMCGAGADAARVAIAAGYIDVAVYPGGIKGWLDGDQAVERFDAARGEES